MERFHSSFSDEEQIQDLLHGLTVLIDESVKRQKTSPWDRSQVCFILCSVHLLIFLKHSRQTFWFVSSPVCVCRMDVCILMLTEIEDELPSAYQKLHFPTETSLRRKRAKSVVEHSVSSSNTLQTVQRLIRRVNRLYSGERMCAIHYRQGNDGKNPLPLPETRREVVAVFIEVFAPLAVTIDLWVVIACVVGCVFANVE